MFDYDKETAKGYVDENKANTYKKAYTEKLSLSNFDAKLIAYYEKKTYKSINSKPPTN